MPTVASIKAAVLWKVGVAIQGGPAPYSDVKPALDALATQIDELWDEAAGDAAECARPGTAVYVKLRRLYTLAACVDVLLGEKWSRVDTLLGGRSGARPSYSQEFKQLLELKKTTLAQIKDVEARAVKAGSGAGAVAEMLTTAPVQPGRYVAPVPAGQPVNTPPPAGADPNWPGWRGDPRLLPGLSTPEAP